MEIVNNIIKISYQTSEGLIRYRTIKFMRVVRISRDTKEMSKFLYAQSDILKSAYRSFITFGTLIMFVNGKFIYSFFSIAESDDSTKAEEIANKNCDILYGAYLSAFKQIGIEALDEQSVSEITRMLLNEKNRIFMVTGIPQPKHSKSGVSKENPFSEGAIHAEQQMEEFVKAVGSSQYIFMNIIRPIPFRIAQLYANDLDEYQKQLDRESEYTENFSFNASTPLSMNNGSSDSTADGNTTGQTSGWGDGFSDSLAHTINNNHTVGSGTGYGDNLSFQEGTGEQIGLNHGDSTNYNRGLSEGWGVNQNYGVNSNENTSFNYSKGDSYNESLNDSISKTTGGTLSHGYSEGKGTTWSTGDGSSVSYTNTVGDSVSAGTSNNINEGYSITGNTNDSKQYGFGENEGTGKNKGFGSSTTYNFGDSINSSLSNNYSGGIGKSGGASVYLSLNNSDNSGFGTNLSTGYNGNWGKSLGSNYNEGDNYNYGQNINESASKSLGISEGANGGFSKGTSSTWGTTHSYAAGVSLNNNSSLGGNENKGYNSSESYNESQSNTNGWSKSEGQSITNGAGYSKGTGEQFGKGQNYNISMNDSAGYSNQKGANWGINKSEGITYGKNNNINYNESTSWGDSFAKTMGMNTNRNWSDNQSASTTFTRGRNDGNSFGLTSGISYGRTYTIKNHRIKKFAQMVESVRNLIWTGKTQGNFLVSSYFTAEDDETCNKGEGGLYSALIGDSAIPIQVVEAIKNKNKIKALALKFEINYDQKEPSIIRKFPFATIMSSQELTALTHIPRIEFGGVRNVDNIPSFAVPEMEENRKNTIKLGHIVVPDFGDVDYKRPFYFKVGRDEINNTIISGTTGSGKTMLATKYVSELAKLVNDNAEKGQSKYLVSGIVFDMKKGGAWRALLGVLPPERVDFKTMGDNLRPLQTNLLTIPEFVNPSSHISCVAEGFCLAYAQGTKSNSLMKIKIEEVFRWETYMVEQLEYFHEKIIEQENLVSNKQERKEKRILISSLAEIRFLKNGIEKILELKQQLKNTYTGKTHLESGKAELIDEQEIMRTNSKRITIEHIYFIFELEKIFKRADGNMSNDQAEAYERITEKLKAFTGNNELNRTFCYNYDDQTIIAEILTKDKITVIEATGIQDNLEVKKFVCYVISGDIFNYAANHFAIKGKMTNYKMCIFEEASDLLPTEAGNQNKQVLDIPQDVWERMASQGREYGLRTVFIVQCIAHLKPLIKTNCPTSFFMKTEEEVDMNYISNRLGKVHTLEMKDVEFKKFMPQMLQGWAIVHNTASTKKIGGAEGVLIKVEKNEYRNIKDEYIGLQQNKTHLFETL